MKLDSEKLSKKDYGSFSPRNQGYASYMQGAWNKSIPDSCPYKFGTREQKNGMKDNL